MEQLEIKDGSYGTYYLNDTEAIDATKMPNGFHKITVLVAATITVLTDKGGASALAAHNIAGESLPAGTIIYARGKFTAITLSAGTVLLD